MPGTFTLNSGRNIFINRIMIILKSKVIFGNIVDPVQCSVRYITINYVNQSLGRRTWLAKIDINWLTG